MTTPKTPTRAEALLPCPFCGGEAIIENTAETLERYLWRWTCTCKNCCAELGNETKSTAVEDWNSRFSIPQQVAGLDMAIEFFQTADVFVTPEHNKQFQPIFEAALLYAQGRTQSALPEGWKLVPVKHPVTSEMKAACIGEFSFKIADVCGECYEEENKNCELCHGEVDYHREITVPWDTCKEIYKAMLSAAPPVTGGGWLPIESAPKDGTKIIAALFAPHIELSDPVVGGIPQAERKGWNFCWASRAQWSEEDQYWHDGLDKLAAFNFWQPLPTPPSSQTRGG